MTSNCPLALLLSSGFVMSITKEGVAGLRCASFGRSKLSVKLVVRQLLCPAFPSPPHYSNSKVCLAGYMLMPSLPHGAHVGSSEASRECFRDILAASGAIRHERQAPPLEDDLWIRYHLKAWGEPGVDRRLDYVW
ncbi:hypothetical protein FB567DRAFT_133469 [Paraphoma chrysanthemicola]|uniref:Uncharacterized protein n=1 Tax=Paraphoma chrysanthemicola TaxID=798071 RepID=A0A8K0VVJ0_9PLEO|nr:hypothetical protein FB567DRAFT_133469 [Paraphoma chrysanthemicola]